MNMYYMLRFSVSHKIFSALLEDSSWMYWWLLKHICHSYQFFLTRHFDVTDLISSQITCFHLCVFHKFFYCTK